MNLRHRIPFALVLSLFAGIASAQQIQVSKDNRTVAITTSDTAKAEADSARVHIGFISYAQDTKAAYADASAISAAIIKALTSAGVDKSAVQSEQQTVAESQPYTFQALSPLEQLQHRYRVEQAWTVRCAAKDAADVLNLAVNSGANNSGQIEWEVRDPAALEAKAIGNALQRARAIAEQMAKGLGAQLGPLVYTSNQSPEPIMFRQQGMAMGVAGTMAPSEQKVTPPLSINPQQVTRSATVYAVFALQ